MQISCIKINVSNTNNSLSVNVWRRRRNNYKIFELINKYFLIFYYPVRLPHYAFRQVLLVFWNIQ